MLDDLQILFSKASRIRVSLTSTNEETGLERLVSEVDKLVDIESIFLKPDSKVCASFAIYTL